MTGERSYRSAVEKCFCYQLDCKEPVLWRVYWNGLVQYVEFRHYKRHARIRPTIDLQRPLQGRMPDSAIRLSRQVANRALRRR